jgi:hypothetical protein
MSLRRLILLVGAVALIAGIIALLVPVSVSGTNGDSIGCGNAIAPDLTAAREADDKNLANVPILNQIVPHTNYVAECESSLSHRRAWSIPLAAVGAIAIAGSLLVRGGPARAGAAGGGLPPPTQ